MVFWVIGTNVCLSVHFYQEKVVVLEQLYIYNLICLFSRAGRSRWYRPTTSGCKKTYVVKNECSLFELGVQPIEMEEEMCSYSTFVHRANYCM